jgi:signal transduction histidine kinase
MQISLKKRLSVLALIAIVFTLCVQSVLFAFHYHQLQQINSSSEQHYAQQSYPALFANVISSHNQVIESLYATSNQAIEPSKQRQVNLELIEKIDQLNDKITFTVSKSTPSNTMTEPLLSLEQQFQRYRQMVKDSLSSSNVSVSVVEQAMFEANQRFGSLSLSFTALIEAQNTVQLNTLNVLKQSTNTRFYVTIAVSIVTLTLLIASIILTRNSITKSIASLVGISNQVASNKDYSMRAQSSKIKEIDDMATALNSMLNLINVQQQELVVAKALSNQADEAKNVFLSRMSHELRTPLNAILGFAQLQLLSQSQNPSHVQASEMIIEAGQKLLIMINDTLDVISMKQQQLSISTTDCDIDLAITQSLAHLTRALDKSGLILIYQPVCAVIQAEPNRLRQVLINLISNAIKYNVIGGSIEIVVNTSLNDTVSIDIIDTGVGIESSIKSSIFDPFTRTIHAENSEIQGTGIGLTITRYLILAMNGQLDFTSEFGKGSTFSVSFRKNQ